MRSAADHLKSLSMELGGKSPCVIFADADLDAAIDSALFGVMSLNGERCTAGSRILAERSVYDSVVARLAERAARVKVGDPRRPGDRDRRAGPPRALRPGPVLRALGTGEGARLVAGGSRPPGLAGGNYLAATVFADVTPSMRIFQEEIFGPVACVTPFDSEAEAVALANDTQVRARRLPLDVGPAPRAPRRRRRRVRDDLGKLAQRAGPAHPVRRGEGQRARPRGRPALDRLLHRVPDRARRAR